ncbi:hypothetical protein Fmac_007321 [Flemingia macrophylla]|uniref:JmjN domain-containing protein n=1 Tax=Flemingia macrophylla TaxID=520843 RepID=A0ABD1MU82_9FABA
MAGKSSITQPEARHGSNKLSKFDLADLEWTNTIPECPVYHPSEHEFENPLVYLQKIAPEASKYARKYTYHEFEALANKAFLSRFHSSESLPSSYVEKEFWHEMAHGEKRTVEYGVNVEGSAFSCDPDDRLAASKWNLKNFSRLLQSPLRLVDKEIPVRKQFL